MFLYIPNSTFRYSLILIASVTGVNVVRCWVSFYELINQVLAKDRRHLSLLLWLSHLSHGVSQFSLYSDIYFSRSQWCYRLLSLGFFCHHLIPAFLTFVVIFKNFKHFFIENFRIDIALNILEETANFYLYPVFSFFFPFFTNS